MYNKIVSSLFSNNLIISNVLRIFVSVKSIQSIPLILPY